MPDNFQLYAAPLTPFDAEGALQLCTIEKQAAHLESNGVGGAFVCGTTGECASLSTSERRQIAARWCDVAASPVIVHVGHNNLNEARELAAHAQQIGAAGIAATAPFYFRTPDAVSTARWCAQIAQAAPDVPFYYYHIPGMTGVDFAVAPFLAIAREQIPTFRGIKFSHGNLFDLGVCLDLAGDLTLFSGSDENLLAVLAMGGRGAVGSSYNLLAPLFVRLIENFDAGDLNAARAEQARARKFVTLMNQSGGIAALKATMKMVGIDCGPCRAPLQNLDDAQKRALCERLNELGFIDCASFSPS